MPTLPTTLPTFCNRSNHAYQPDGGTRHILHTCKMQLMKFLPQACFPNARREQEVEEMLHDEDIRQQLRFSECAASNDEIHGEVEYRRINSSEKNGGVHRCNTLNKPGIRYHSPRGKSGSADRHKLSKEADPISTAPKGSSTLGKNLCETADQVVPSLPSAEPPQRRNITITKHDMKVMAEELEKEGIGSKRDAKTERSRRSKEENIGTTADNAVRFKAESGNSVDEYGIADFERLLDENQEMNTAESHPASTRVPIGRDDIPNIHGQRKGVSFAKQNVVNGHTNAAAYYCFDPCYSNQKPIPENMYAHQAGLPKVSSEHPTTQVHNNAAPCAEVPQPAANIWAVKEEVRASSQLKNQAGPSHVPQMHPKSPVDQASIPTRQPDDILDELFADMRNFASDVEETLTVVADHAQKRHKILAKRMRAREIELHRAGQISEIPLLLEKAAECQRSNEELRKCLQAVGERLASSYYRSG